MKFRNNTKINHCNYQLLAKIILEGISLVQPKQFINKMMQVFQTLKKKKSFTRWIIFTSSGKFFKVIIIISKFRGCVPQEIQVQNKFLWVNITAYVLKCVLPSINYYQKKQITDVYHNYKLLENDSVAEVSTSTKA